MPLKLSDVNTFVWKYILPRVPLEGVEISWSGFMESANTLDITGEFRVRPADKPTLNPVIRRVTLYGVDDVLARGPQSAFSLIEAKMAKAVAYIAWALRSRIVSWRVEDLCEQPANAECRGAIRSLYPPLTTVWPDGEVILGAIDRVVIGGVRNAS